MNVLWVVLNMNNLVVYSFIIFDILKLNNFQIVVKATIIDEEIVVISDWNVLCSYDLPSLLTIFHNNSWPDISFILLNTILLRQQKI